MQSERVDRVLCACASALCVLAASAMAGELDPPAGPVAPTGVMLTDIEPRIVINFDNTPGDADSIFRIIDPGAYVMIADLDMEADKHGIEIASDDVSIDMRKFTIRGVENSLDGIHVDGARVRLRVTDGHIVGAGGDGFNASSANSVTTREIEFRLNGGSGMRAGDDSEIKQVTAMSNEVDGVKLGLRAIVRDTRASFNGNHGVDLDIDGEVIRVYASDNTMNGVNAGNSLHARVITTNNNDADGINAGANANIEDAQSNGNMGRGVVVSSNSRVAAIVATDNDLAGIDAGPTCVIEAVAVDNCGQSGVVALSGSVVRDARVSECGTAGVAAVLVGDASARGGLVENVVVTKARDFGIDVMEGVQVINCVAAECQSTGFRGFRSTFIDCLASANEGNGYVSGAGTRLSDCDARDNFVNGYLLGDQSQARGCRSVGNGGEGFLIQGAANVSDCQASNHVLGAGFRVQNANCPTIINCDSKSNKKGFELDATSVSVFLAQCRAIANAMAAYENPMPAMNRVAPIQSDISMAGPWDNIE